MERKITGIMLKERSIIKVEEEVGEKQEISKVDERRIKREGNKVIYGTTIEKYFDGVSNEEKEVKISLENKGSYYSCEENYIKTKIDGESGTSRGILLDDGEHSILLSSGGKSGVKGVLGEALDTVIYENLFSKGDLEYEVKSNGVGANIIIKEKQETYLYSFTIESRKLEVKYEEAKKRIVFLDTDEKELYEMPLPYMVDGQDEGSEKIGISFSENHSDLHSVTYRLDKDWINKEGRVFPVEVMLKIKKIERATIRLANYNKGKRYEKKGEELLLGAKNNELYEVVGTIASEHIISEIEAKGIKRYQVGIRLHYRNGKRKENSKGISIYCNAELVSRNELIGEEGDILVDITEIIKKEEKKYQKGLVVADIKLTYIYSESSNNGSEEESESGYEDDYVIIEGCLHKEKEKRPEIYLEGIREGEVKAGTPYKEYDIDKGGRSLINLYNSNLTHVIGLGRIRNKGLEIGVSLVYDKRKEEKSSPYGKGWKINLNQRIEKSKSYSKLLGSKEVTYYDGENNPHVLNERWYYEIDGVRYYIGKEEVYIDNDQKLKNKDKEGKVHEVEYEVTNEDGLMLISIDSKENYNKKSDLRSKERYYIRLKDTERYELIKDEEGKVEVPYFDNGIDIEDVSYKEGKFYIGEALVEATMRRQQLLYRKGKAYVRYITKEETYCINNKQEDTYSVYEIEDIEKRVIEVEEEKEYYVDRSIPVADYYENEDIETIKRQIEQYQEQVSILKEQEESISNEIIREEDEINHQKSRREIVNDSDSAYDVAAYNHTIKSLTSRLKDTCQSLKRTKENKTRYETELKNLKEQKEALIKTTKEGVQDYLIDKGGNILGFDYEGKLIYLSDYYENEIMVIYEEGKIIEITREE